TYNESEEIKALLRFRNFITVENSSKARAHYTSLKDAVNDLKADGTGGTIFLRNGTYDEPDTIDLGNYKWIFEGESQAGVIIQKSSDNANPLFTFDANEKNILFANLTLRNDSGVTTASPVFLKGHATTTKAGVLHISGCKIDHDLGPVIIARKKDIQIFTCGINCTNLIDNPSSSSDGISIHIQNIALEDTNTGPTGSELFTIAGNDDDYLTLKDSRFTEVKNKVVNITKGGSMIVNNYIYMHAFTSTQTAENRKPIFIDSIEVNNIIGNYIKLDEPANDVELGIEAIHVMQSSSQQREGVVDNIIDLKLQLESTWVGFAWDVEGIELYGGQAVVMNNQAKIDLDTYSTSPIDVVGIKVKMNSGFGEKVNIFSNYLELVGTPTANSYGVELELDVDYCIIKNNHIKNFTTGVQDNSGKANNIIADNL
ncbi:hypothetical protein KAR91_69515, partial [Candidatus Pacearchaeota archaeon]|nr:hypothetical protein [Candidatus Pacearchaeota archaeon]